MLFFKRFYLFIQERVCAREHKQREWQREREEQAPCWEPDVGFDPRILRSWPEPKVALYWLSPPDLFININFEA